MFPMFFGVRKSFFMYVENKISIQIIFVSKKKRFVCEGIASLKRQNGIVLYKIK